jgi:hypothetical protein
VLVVAIGALVVAPAPPAAADRPAPAVAWRERVEVAAGGGSRGPWRMNESVYDYVDDPTVALDAPGFVGVAWVDQSRKDVFFRLYGPDGRPRLDAPVNVSRSPRVFSWLPRVILAGPEGRDVFVLWQEIVFSGGSHGGEIFFARSADGGRTFSAPLNLSNTVAGAGKGRLDARRWDNGSLDLARGPGGALYAAWTEYEGALWFSRSTDGGRRFSMPLRVAGGGEAPPARGPALAVGPRDTVYLAWTVGEDPAADIHLARSDDAGRTFGAPRVVAASGGHADAPAIAVDGTGTVHLVYAERPAGAGAPSRLRYARSSDGAVFTDPREIVRPPVGAAGFPALSVDGADRLYVVWEVFPGRGGRSRGLGFTHSGDGGRTFAAPGLVPGTGDPADGVNGSQQGLLMRKLAVNDAGAIVVVNSTFRSTAASRVWLIRGQVR